MIIDNTFFKGEIYISNARPSLNSKAKSISTEIQIFIDEYERDCLIKCLGFTLYKEFLAEIDMTQANGLKTNADAKWDDLLNGKEYTDTNSESVVWSGIRQKIPSTSDDYNYSFLANYVYWYYEKNAEITISSVGHVKPKAKNAITMSPVPKAVKSWRKFIKLVQGEEVTPNIIIKDYGLGVDYFRGGEETSLYKFIKDINNLVEDTYENFKPKLWINQNQLGI